MISFTWVLNTYGEPYSPSSLAGCTGYTGKYFTWSLLSVLVFYLLWIGVQLPQGEYISYGRGYLMVSIWCKVGYNSPGSLGTHDVTIDLVIKGYFISKHCLMINRSNGVNGQPMVLIGYIYWGSRLRVPVTPTPPPSLTPPTPCWVPIVLPGRSGPLYLTSSLLAYYIVIELLEYYTWYCMPYTC